MKPENLYYLVTFPATVTFSIRANSPEEALEIEEELTDSEPWDDVEICGRMAYVGTTGNPTVEEDEQANA